MSSGRTRIWDPNSLALNSARVSSRTSDHRVSRRRLSVMKESPWAVRWANAAISTQWRTMGVTWSGSRGKGWASTRNSANRSTENVQLSTRAATSVRAPSPPLHAKMATKPRVPRVLRMTVRPASEDVEEPQEHSLIIVAQLPERIPGCFRLPTMKLDGLQEGGGLPGVHEVLLEPQPP